MAHDDDISTKPVIVPAWRGRFNILKRDQDINISAHISNKACTKVWEVASVMPESLCLEMIPRVDVWPASFKSSPPTEHSVALFFFAEGRDGELLDSLLYDAMWKDLALKAIIGNSELLIFTSLQLPNKLHKFQGKFYMWGVFRAHQKAYSSRPSDLSSNFSNTMSFEEKGSPVDNSSKDSHLSNAAKAEKRGRHLDDAWEHVKPLDVARQKTQCNYCGFISTYGGISRLKAHLGGGCPKTQLQGCPKVSQQVKSVMERWFNEWAKNSKADWLKQRSSAYNKKEGGAEAENRGRRLDDAWQHAKALDEARQKTQCNYCGFISSYGGISRLKAHLGGGCPKTQLQGCHKVSPEVESAMRRWFNEWAQNSKAMWLKSFHGKPSEIAAPAKTSKRERQLDDSDTWEHDVPLDKMRHSTKLKYSDCVSKDAEIARLKTNLGGGDPACEIQGFPSVYSQVKSSTAKDRDGFSGKPNGATVETVREVLQGSGKTDSKVPQFEKNTSLKESLRKVIDEKNSELQKMHVEVLYLESRLASMP